MTGTVWPQFFDSHLHIIDPRFDLIPNDGYLPAAFTVQDYLARTAQLGIVGGAVVSGSFQGFDTAYLVDALEHLGSGFVGVAQLPATVSEDEILALDRARVRAVRINLRRGGSESIDRLRDLAHLVHGVAGWHVELYVDSRDLPELAEVLASLPAVSIDHLGLSSEGFPHLLRLAETGVRIKATGFGRVDFNVAGAIRAITEANPQSLMVGTDLPSTRAPRAFRDTDLALIAETLDEDIARAVFLGNAVSFYRLTSISDNQ